MWQIRDFFRSDSIHLKSAHLKISRICPIWGQSDPLWVQIWHLWLTLTSEGRLYERRDHLSTVTVTRVRILYIKIDLKICLKIYSGKPYMIYEWERKRHTNCRYLVGHQLTLDTRNCLLRNQKLQFSQEQESPEI